MALIDYKLAEDEMVAGGVVSLPDKPSEEGINAQRLKQAFDNLSSSVIKKKYNDLIDALLNANAADDIGGSVAGLNANTVAGLITELKKLLEDEVVRVEARFEDYVLLKNITDSLIGADSASIPNVGAINEQNAKIDNDINNIASKLNEYVPKSNVVTSLTGAENTSIPTVGAVNELIIGAGAGDMLSSIYDPNKKKTDIFGYVDQKVANIPTPDVSGQINAHNTSPTAHSGFLATINYVDEKVANIPTPDVSGQISAHNVSSNAHSGMFAPAYTYGTTDMTAGTSELESGKLYFVYE